MFSALLTLQRFSSPSPYPTHGQRKVIETQEREEKHYTLHRACLSALPFRNVHALWYPTTFPGMHGSHLGFGVTHVL